MNFPCWRSRGSCFWKFAEHRREQPQALLISGDIYDKPVPPTEAVKLLDDFLTEVSKRGLHTYLIAGNHDSAQRLEFGKEIFGRKASISAAVLARDWRMLRKRMNMVRWKSGCCRFQAGTCERPAARGGGFFLCGGGKAFVGTRED